MEPVVIMTAPCIGGIPVTVHDGDFAVKLVEFFMQMISPDALMSYVQQTNPDDVAVIGKLIAICTGVGA